MSRSPSRNQSSPPKLAADSSAFQVSSASPAALGVDEPAERVQQAVEVGRDVESEDLEVVADVADDGELAGREDAGEAAREARPPPPPERRRPSRGTARSARVRARAAPRGARGQRRVDVGLELGNGNRGERRMRAEAFGAPRAVERREEPDRAARARSSCRRQLRRARARRRPTCEARPTSPGRSAFTTSACPVHVTSPAATAAPEPSPGIAPRPRPRRDDRRIVGDDEHATDLERRLDDVPEHRNGDSSAQRRRQASLRVSAIRDHDRRHAAKVTRRSGTSRSRRGRTSPTRGRRTSACHAAPRPHRCPCGRG